jgi:hypothetical protein
VVPGRLTGRAVGARFNAGQGEVLPVGNQSAPGCYWNPERLSDQRKCPHRDNVKQITTQLALF